MAKSQVFDIYAHEYDLITNAAAREQYHSKEIKALIYRFHPNHVLDAGCASGLTSILFARQGIKTVGLDRSRKMLEQAKAKARKIKDVEGIELPLTFRFGTFENLPQNMNGKFDLIVCLANSVSGVRTKADLHRVMKNFSRVLKPGGVLVIQTLNYASIKEGEFFPIKATSNDGIVWLRYSRRKGSRLEVHVVRLDTTDPAVKFEPFVNEFDNYSVDVVERTVQSARLEKIRKYGDLYLSKRFGKKSRDLVLTAVKP